MALLIQCDVAPSDLNRITNQMPTSDRLTEREPVTVTVTTTSAGPSDLAFWRQQEGRRRRQAALRNGHRSMRLPLTSL